MQKVHKLKTEEFIAKARAIHKNKYDYSKVEYTNNKTKICIICPIHGEFWQTPDKHLNRKQGCPKCAKENFIPYNKHSKENFIDKANKMHNSKYDYSKVKYINSHEKICIICHEKDENGNEHGEFWQTPYHHLRGEGCKKCQYEKIKTTLSSSTEEFIKRSKEVHGNKYDYSKVEYKNAHSKVCIICHEKDENGEEHGEFWQMPYSHLNGRGCSLCNKQGIGKEYSLFKKLTQTFNDIEIIYQYRNKDIFNNLSLDIFIPQYSIAIEYQGSQHFMPIDKYGSFIRFIKDSRLFLII